MQLATLAIAADVSIPERVWGGLEPVLATVRRPYAHVSIPERVWGGLEPKYHALIHLKGCVSIPERVWGGLEPSQSNHAVSA